MRSLYDVYFVIGEVVISTRVHAIDDMHAITMARGNLSTAIDILADGDTTKLKPRRVKQLDTEPLIP